MQQTSQASILANATLSAANERQCTNRLLLTQHILVLVGACVLSAVAAEETHSDLQAVTSTGTSAWNGTFPITLRGVLLCDPEEMLDSTPGFLSWNDGANAGRMGGEWQITFQAVAPGDRGGTTCWMGQNYANRVPPHDDVFSYPNPAWVAEVCRLNFDPNTGHKFRAADLIEVTAQQALFYGGKRNINEGHDVDPGWNFSISLIASNYGLPALEVIALADVMQPGGIASDSSTWVPIFDQTRATGGEHYQGMRIRMNNITLVTTNGWNPTNIWGSRLCTVTDGAGRFFSLRTPRYSLGPAPTNQFDAIGIFTQESGMSNQGTNGYELFVQQIFPHNPPPEMTVRLNVTISWPASTDTYRLEWREKVDTGIWTAVTNAPLVGNGVNMVIFPPSSPQRFYQLRKTN